MVQRIVRYQLLLLFVFSAINLVGLFYYDQFPDHAMSIGSTVSTNIVSYALFSVLSYIYYFTGVWIVFAFLFYVSLFLFVLSSRIKLSHLFLFFSVLFVTFNLFYLVYPSFIGEGLRYISDVYLTHSVSIVSTLVFGLSILYAVLRSPVQQIRSSFSFLGSKFLSFYNFGLQLALRVLRNFDKQRLINAWNRKIYNIKQREGSSEHRAQRTMSNSEHNIENLNDLNPNTESDINEEEVVVVNPPPKQEITKVPVKKTLRSKNQHQFFKSDELINCISHKNVSQKSLNPDQEYFRSITAAIEEKLQEFKIEAKIINILKGPVVDTFELDLGPGIKVSRVTGLSDDLGLALNGAPIRIVYPMRGKSTIGIEVPRNPREIIYLDEVLKSRNFNNSRHRLPVAMGKDAFGEVSVVDLAGMPHMLVAGATGAGKSVFINTLLVSLIIKKKPNEMKLILIDPKQLELALYQELPHLMMPVITEAKSAAIALLWAVQEMERRYSILKEIGVKNIEGLNKKIGSCGPEVLSRIDQYYENETTPGYELPYLVVIIDEFADLILTKSGKEIEDNVNRLAAKARASGIHLVLATQRPSTDVVTGVIKANFPTRISFRVTTGMDSKVVLDQYGAEKLLGRGDMLYKHGVDVMRLHSAYVDEEEIEGLVDKLSTIPADFNQNAIDFLENGGELEDGDVRVSFGAPSSEISDQDELYGEAVKVVVENGQASASMLQRRLRVGYNRAANLVEQLEKKGVVGPQQGSKPRKVLLAASEE